MDYIANILKSGAIDEYKPHIYCNEDASTLFVGNNSAHVKGDKQRQAIKIICDLYAENPDGNIRWNNVTDIADFGIESRYRDLFKKSKVSNFISYKVGIIEFKTE